MTGTFKRKGYLPKGVVRADPNPVIRMTRTIARRSGPSSPPSARVPGACVATRSERGQQDWRITSLLEWAENNSFHVRFVFEGLDVPGEVLHRSGGGDEGAVDPALTRGHS